MSVNITCFGVNTGVTVAFSITLQILIYLPCTSLVEQFKKWNNQM